jgi:hypothetical protein
MELMLSTVLGNCAPLRTCFIVLRIEYSVHCMEVGQIQDPRMILR